MVCCKFLLPFVSFVMIAISSVKKSNRKFSEKFDRHPTKQFQNSPNPCQTASRISDKYSPLKFILRIRKHFPLVYYFLNLKMGVFLPNSSRSLYSHFVLIEAFGVEKHPTPFVLCALFLFKVLSTRGILACTCRTRSGPPSPELGQVWEAFFATCI